MSHELLKVTATLLWMGVALASAAPANALAKTSQVGNYATCSSSYQAASSSCSEFETGVVFYFNYTQNIKFVTSPCNSGGCSSEPGTVYVQSVYDTGRKTATMDFLCSGQRIYDIGICAC